MRVLLRQKQNCTHTHFDRPSLSLCAASTSANTNLPGTQVADAVNTAVKANFSRALDAVPKKNLAVLFEGEQEAAFVIQLTTSAQNGQTFDLSARLFTFGLEIDNIRKFRRTKGEKRLEAHALTQEGF